MSNDAGRARMEADVLAAVVRMIAGAVLYSHEVAEKIGLGPSDTQFLTLLEVHGPLTPGRLADLSGLRTGTVTGVLDRLERAGYVRRERSAEDRRKVIVSRAEERIAADMGAFYGSKGAGLMELLGRYDDAELAIVADFATRLAQP
ncbi:DNA-binding transcriptional regulator, MarR family [Parafrankia irregularis]|uniref:DNA-binding transcriptional regulator, MarR family n=1 Tax=Parafrankia irregularis TaxID=795642 RepID=A0A0S4QVP9_9ACTN|nr:MULTISPECIES: MarR family transcriptional regulator [Parafrankia]MBE3203669.1 MarR family transcriptional regulator [Parafrankia sp. CH37]CUU59090.1 DNA-binding transcriptional regulator, MarR family [Parafrankia irregularis]